MFDAMFVQCFVEVLQDVQRIDFGFEVEHNHVVECLPFGIHHGDRGGNARRPQFDSFVGECDHEIVHALVLQQRGNFFGAAAIRERFDHHGDMGVRQ